MSSNVFIVFGILIIILLILIKRIIDSVKTTKELKEEIKIMEQRIENEKMVKQAIEKKEKEVNTSDDNTNFSNSLNFLRDYANRK